MRTLVFLEDTVVDLLDWPELSDYPRGTILHTPTDSSFPWCRITGGQYGGNSWKSVELRDVPIEYRAMALLLT